MISLDPIPQFVVHYACKIPFRTELKPSERDGLKALLQNADAEHFQIFPADAQNLSGIGMGIANQPPGLLTVFRQYPMEEGAIATAPTLIFQNDSITIPVLIKVGKKFCTASRNVQAKEWDQKMKALLFQLPDVVKGLKYSRIGKVYELVMPIAQDKKEAFLRKFLSDPSTGIAEIGLVITNIHPVEGKNLNINTQLRFQQMTLEQPLVVSLRVDINNRDLATSMDPRDVDFVWNNANAIIESHLEKFMI